MIFWTRWSKFLFSKRSVSKHRAFRFWSMSQKNPKSKDVFDITGRVLSETAVNNIFLLPLNRGNVTSTHGNKYIYVTVYRDIPIFYAFFFFSMSLRFCSVPLPKHVLSFFFLVFWFPPFLCMIFVYAANAPGTLINPLSPEIQIQILQTDLHTFVLRTVERIWFKIKALSVW